MNTARTPERVLVDFEGCEVGTGGIQDIRGIYKGNSQVLRG